MEIRPYQTKAIKAVYNYFHHYDGNPLIVLPTGTGKSIVIAEFVRGAIESWPATRIIIATHNRDLVRQNFLEFCELCPLADVGIYSAGLKSRETESQIIFCGIQSAYDKAFEFQKCDILIVDECHTISHNGDSMWGRFIGDLKTINRDLKVIGLSATPFRMDSGLLTDKPKEGEPLFNDIIFDYSILDAVKDQWLCEVISKSMLTEFDLTGVHKRGGEFIAGELERAVNVDSITKAAIDEIILLGANRKTWLLFCSGVDHAHAVCNEINARGIECACITGQTPLDERDDILTRFKMGELRAVTNNNVMTTGTNVPRIDLIAGLRPTGSAGLHIQMLGRGMRRFEGKTNCLYLDFAKNVFRFGPLDKIKPKKPGGGGGDAPVKVCIAQLNERLCHCVCFAGVRICPDCGTPFPEPELKIKKSGDSESILSNQIAPETVDVNTVMVFRHEKEGKTTSMRVAYFTDLGTISEWICFEHTGFAREKAVSWHRKRLPAERIPASVTEAMGLPYPAPSRITVRKNGKFFDILSYDFTERETVMPIQEIKDDEWSVKW